MSGSRSRRRRAPLTAEAGARVLREGGNAVDAAVAAVLTSFVTESPLTGFGAGGFMLVHTAPEDVLLDFFVEVPGRERRRAALRAGPDPGLLRPDSPQVFNVGAASCGVPGHAGRPRRGAAALRLDADRRARPCAGVAAPATGSR